MLTNLLNGIILLVSARSDIGGSFGVITKACSKCGEEKPLSGFYKQLDCRFGVSPRCKACAKTERAAKYKDTPDKAKQAAAEWRKNNQDKVAEYESKAAQIREEKKKEKIARRGGKTTKQIFQERNREKVNSWNSEAQRKRLSTPKGRLDASFRKRVRDYLLPGGKEGRRTFEILGYTVSNLLEHLESLFQPGMSWENYGRGHGKWNIDHKVPLSAHSYTKVSDPDFIEAWKLSNLQPMWSVENSAKGPRISEKYGNAPPKRLQNHKHPRPQEHQ